MAPNTLRPRSVTEIIDASFHLVRRYFSPLLVLSAVASIPSIAFALIMMNLTPGDAEAGQASSGAGVVLLTIALTTVTMCWSFVSYGAMLSAASRGYLAQTVDPAAAMRHAFTRAKALIVSNFLGTLRVMLPIFAIGAIGAVLLGVTQGTAMRGIVIVLIAVLAIPALVYFVRAFAQYMLLSAVAVLENHGVRDTVRRTWTLTDGFRLRIVGVALVVSMILFTLMVLLILLLNTVVSHPKVAEAITQAIMIPLMPLFWATVTVLYYDIRVRKEGFDLEVLEAQVAPSGMAPSRA